jgi:carboxypeptidase family protein
MVAAMRNFRLAVLLAFALSVATSATVLGEGPEQVKVSGLIIDAGTGAGIPGAVVTLRLGTLPQQSQALTDDHGRFSMDTPSIPAPVNWPQDTTVTIQAKGYQESSRHLEVTAAVHVINELYWIALEKLPNTGSIHLDGSTSEPIQVAVGTDIYVTMFDIGPMVRYGSPPTISSSSVEFLGESDGPPTPGGPERHFHLKAVHAGHAVIVFGGDAQVPPGTPESMIPATMVTDTVEVH